MDKERSSPLNSRMGPWKCNSSEPGVCWKMSINAYIKIMRITLGGFFPPEILVKVNTPKANSYNNIWIPALTTGDECWSTCDWLAGFNTSELQAEKSTRLLSLTDGSPHLTDPADRWGFWSEILAEIIPSKEAGSKSFQSSDKTWLISNLEESAWWHGWEWMSKVTIIPAQYKR